MTRAGPLLALLLWPSVLVAEARWDCRITAECYADGCLADPGLQFALFQEAPGGGWFWASGAGHVPTPGRSLSAEGSELTAILLPAGDGQAGTALATVSGAGKLVLSAHWLDSTGTLAPATFHGDCEASE